MLGKIIPYAAPKELKTAVENLTRAFGSDRSDAEIKRLARESFRMLALNFVDTVRLRAMRHCDIIRLSIPHNFDRLTNAVKEGRGVIILASHAGSWEWSAGFIAIEGIPVSGVATKMYDPRLEKMLNESREYMGIKVISRGNNTRDIIRALKKGGAVGVLIDQDTKVKGDFVDFFGHPAHTATGPALLSLKYNAPIIPVLTCRGKNHRHHIWFGDPVTAEPTGNLDRDILALTQKCSAVIEDFIREHPEQWVWFHKRWKTQNGSLKSQNPDGTTERMTES